TRHVREPACPLPQRQYNGPIVTAPHRTARPPPPPPLGGQNVAPTATSVRPALMTARYKFPAPPESMMARPDSIRNRSVSHEKPSGVAPRSPSSVSARLNWSDVIRVRGSSGSGRVGAVGLVEFRGITIRLSIRSTPFQVQHSECGRRYP